MDNSSCRNSTAAIIAAVLSPISVHHRLQPTTSPQTPILDVAANVRVDCRSLKSRTSLPAFARGVHVQGGLHGPLVILAQPCTHALSPYLLSPYPRSGAAPLSAPRHHIGQYELRRELHEKEGESWVVVSLNEGRRERAVAEKDIGGEVARRFSLGERKARLSMHLCFFFIF